MLGRIFLHSSRVKREDSGKAAPAGHHAAHMNFEFATATRIIFGTGSASRLPELAAPFGRRILLVTGSSGARQTRVTDALNEAGFELIPCPIHGEPTTHEAEAGARLAQQSGAQLVISLGGGSVVDAGKAIAALASQPGSLLDYLEVIGQGRPLEAKPLPFFALPTTAGTGAEVTRNAVLTSPEHRVKASLRHADMLPTLALIDPSLTLQCPPAITAASGMDALTQCLEALVSSRAQAMTDALCAEGIRRGVRSLERAVLDGADLAAREDMALAALFSGMALANAGLGAVHGFAAPLGGMFHAPHGAVCAALLAPVWQANLRAIRKAGTSAALEKFRLAAVLLTGLPDAEPEAACERLHELTTRLRIPGLASLGVGEQDYEEISHKAAQASSMKGNPTHLEHASLVEILRSAA